MPKPMAATIAAKMEPGIKAPSKKPKVKTSPISRTTVTSIQNCHENIGAPSQSSIKSPESDAMVVCCKSKNNFIIDIISIYQAESHLNSFIYLAIFPLSVFRRKVFYRIIRRTAV